jgi:hypothetical protein
MTGDSVIRPAPIRKVPPSWGLFVLLSLSVARPAAALDYQVHGYAAQGFVLSGGNNVFGDSTHGSINYYEVGLNACIQPRPDLLFAAQGAIRDAGATDDGVPRIDYALADYRFLAALHASAGLRLGWVKNPLGFFNETRDVIFTRPGILLPSGYGDNYGTRSLLFSAAGAQLYTGAVLGDHELSLGGTMDLNRSLSESQKQALFGLSSVPFSLDVRSSWNMQIMDSIDGGRWQAAYSHYYGSFILSGNPSIDALGHLFGGQDIFSLRYNAHKFSITSEYIRAINKDFNTQGKVTRDSTYLQGDFRLSPAWRLMTRIDTAFLDDGDRNGHEYAAAHPGADPASRFAYDFTTGVNWRYGSHWGVWAEYHRIYGTAALQPLVNTGHTPDDHWSLFMLMIGCRF